MIDYFTGERIVVLISDVYGPFFRVFKDREPKELEEILQGEFYIPYWVEKHKTANGVDVLEYYFGRAADPGKLQVILDGKDNII